MSAQIQVKLVALLVIQLGQGVIKMVLEDSKILIIEDSETYVNYLQESLQSCELIICKTGREGLRAAFNLQPDLILLDLTLPDIDGLKLCKRFKKNAELTEIPVIILTGRDDINIAFKLGVNDYLKKPFSREELMARIKVRIKQKKLEKELNNSYKKIANINQKLKEKVAQIERTNELYSILDKINKFSKEFDDRGKLFEKAVQILVEFEGFKLVWVGIINYDNLQLEPVVQAGELTEYLEDIFVSVNPNLPEGKGPTAEATSENKHVVINDFIKSSETNPWKRVAQKIGIKSGAVYPIKEGGEVIGTLNVYSDKLNFFTEERVDVLDKIVRNISLALDRFKERKERKKAQESLRESRKQFKSIFDTANEAIISINSEGKIILWNNAATEIFGYSSKEAIGNEITTLIPKEFRFEHKKRLNKIKNNGESMNVNAVEVVGLKKDKTEVPLELSLSNLQTNNKIFLTCIIRDITERKKKNQALENAYAELNASFEQAKKLHQYFLPDDPPETENISLAAYYQPARKLGGDFYDIEKVGKELIFYLADVSGHSLDGALLNVLVRENIKNFISELGIKDKETHSYDWLLNKDKYEDLKPKRMLNHILNKYNQEDFPEDYFLCLQVGILDLEKMTLKYSNAGFHILPFIISNIGKISSLSEAGLPISNAIEEEKFKFEEKNYNLSPGEKFFFTTDGLIEEMTNGNMYGEERLKEILRENHYLPPELIIEKVKKDFTLFTGKGNDSDDITILALERKQKQRLERKFSSDLGKMYEVEEEIEKFLTPYTEDIIQLKIGLHELLVNAIEHGNKLDFDKEVSIEVCVGEEYIRMVITDEGNGFDWRQKVQNKLDIEDFDERGRGIILAQKAYDRLTYNDQGNKVCIIKFR